jgi:uncharacterized damage-inducible protein DinB
MNLRSSLAAAALTVLPAIAAAQTPVADALRANAKQYSKNLSAAAEVMPAEKYGYKPTPAQMSYGDIVTHLIEGNDYLCGLLGTMPAPTRTKLAATDKKEALVARLKETFAFCDQALAKLDDSRLSEQVTLFGTLKMTRAAAQMLTVGDWADHYSQMAIYLRLNGQLPPTAKK